jgi:hypothetical protein
VTGVHIEGRTREGDGTSPRWTTTARPSCAGYTRELEPGHLGRAKPAKATELQAHYKANFICIGLDLFRGPKIYLVSVILYFHLTKTIYYLFASLSSFLWLSNLNKISLIWYIN